MHQLTPCEPCLLAQEAVARFTAFLRPSEVSGNDLPCRAPLSQFEELGVVFRRETLWKLRHQRERVHREPARCSLSDLLLWFGGSTLCFAPSRTIDLSRLAASAAAGSFDGRTICAVAEPDALDALEALLSLGATRSGSSEPGKNAAATAELKAATETGEVEVATSRAVEAAAFEDGVGKTSAADSSGSVGAEMGARCGC